MFQGGIVPFGETKCAFRDIVQPTTISRIGQAILAQQGEANSLKYFINATFNNPTMAEAYRVATLNGYNRLF